MSRRRRRTLALFLGGIYFAGLGFLSGIVVERMRFDAARSAVLTHLTDAQQRLHGRLMDLERDAGGGRDGVGRR
jgi:hypothetical protein